MIDTLQSRRWDGFSPRAWLAACLLCLALDFTRAAQPLTTLQYQILGTQLQVSPVAVSVPKGIAGSVLAQLVAVDGSTSGVDASIASGAYLEAILRGPAFPARRLVGQPGQALVLPPINLSGEYQLDGIRLVDAATGATRLEGSPSSVPVHVFDQVLVSTVTSRPLSMDEITERGIVIDANNFRAVEFEVGFVLDGQTIPVKLAVVAPDFTQSTEVIPAGEMFSRLVEARLVNDQLSQQLAESAEFPAALRRPGLNIQVKAANFQISAGGEVNLNLKIPPIPALMIIPGNIGYLNQFFSVQIFTENASPLGSALSVSDLTARLNLPPGRDGILSTNYTTPGDDPLRFARVGSQAETHDTRQLFGPPPASAARLYPGQSASAEFLVEGLQEGLHVLDLDLDANLHGLAAGPVRITGKAAGSVLVRNPKFSLAFSHPKTIRSGEPYTAYVTVLNTGSDVANLVSITLRGASISGGTLLPPGAPEQVDLGSIAPGQSATASFRIMAQRTGSIQFSNLTTGENSVQGRFNLTLGIDERGVELSPDTIGFPDFVSYLPSSVMDAANRVLGQALSAATAPLLPPGVKPVSRATITRRVLELAEAGQRIKYTDPTNRVLIDLGLDWQGGRIADDLVRQQIRVGDEFLTEASRGPVVDEGFDQILQSTEAGRQFRAALLEAAENSDPSAGDDTARLVAEAPELVGRGEPWLLASSGDPALETQGSGATGSATVERSDLAGATVYPGQRGNWLVVHAGSSAVLWKAASAVARADLAVVLLGTDGTGTRWGWTVRNLPAGAGLRFDPAAPTSGLARDDDGDGVPEEFVVATEEPVRERPPEIRNVVQDTDVVLSRPDPHCTAGPARNYGHVLGILFSKPMVQARVSVPTAYQLDNGTHASHIQVQPGGRIALVSLREGVSALRQRFLTVSGITDARGNPVVPAPEKIETDFHDGVQVEGKVLRADGTPAAGVPVTITMNDLRQDPSDCPLIATRIAQKYTDADGLFDFDFVLAGVPFTIAALDTGGLSVEAIRTILDSTVGDRFAAEKLAALAAATNALAALGVGTLTQATRMVEGLDRAVWQDQIEYEGARMGQKIVVGLRFRGRAVVTGTVFQSDGLTPVAEAAVNLFPAPDSREQGRGMFTDRSGRFEFNGVPLGPFTIRVQTRERHFRTIAGNLIEVGTTNDLAIVLTAPEVHELDRSSLRGRVVDADGVTGHAQARVYISQGTASVIAASTAGNDGYWQVDDIPTGWVDVQAVSRDGRHRAQGRADVISSATAFVLTTLSGTGDVVGRVEMSDGRPATNALVAGGLTLVRTDGNGLFRLTGVPQGPTRIAAGLEAADAPGGFPRVAHATVTVLPGVEIGAVLRFPAAGRIIGQVVDAYGDPVTHQNVAIPLPGAGGFAWAKLDANGRFEFPNLPPGDYIVSAPAPPVSEEDVERILEEAAGGSADQIAAALRQAVTVINRVVARRLGDAPTLTPGSFGWTTVSLRSDGETASADIQYSPEGQVRGTVLNHQGVPIGASVRLTGPGLDNAGAPATVILGNATSDPALGTFAFPRLPRGAWALQAASPFYPSVLVVNGFTLDGQLDLTNVVLRFPPQAESNGRLVGQVLLPDGSPAGAGVRVKISFGSDYVITTDTNGVFDTQFKLPARSYTVEAHDELTGLRGQSRVVVQAGITNATTVPLLGKGAAELTVYQAGGAPAANASVQASLSTFPFGTFEQTTDGNGRVFFDNLFAGRYGLAVNFITAGGHLEGAVGILVEAGSTNAATVTLGPTGTIRGVFRKRNDGTPVENARVTLGSSGVATTDHRGAFEVSGLSLGPYKIVAREPVSGRAALASATLSFDGQVADVALTELAQGDLQGTVFQSGESGPIAGATVTLGQDPSLGPAMTITTGPDGAYRFPAAVPGSFTLTASKGYEDGGFYHRTVRGTYPADARTLTVDVTLPARVVYGRVVVRVCEPDGSTPATSALVNSIHSTDELGQVVFDALPLGTQIFQARSTLPGQTSSAGKATVVLTTIQTNITSVITLSGVGRVHGRVVRADGLTPEPGAEVKAEGRAFDIVRNARTFTDANGEFDFDNLPIAPVGLTVVSGPLASSGSTTLSANGQTAEVVLRLDGSGSVLGRLLRADGMTVAPNVPVVLRFDAPSGLDGIATVFTDDEGTFRFDSIPVGTNELVATAPEFNGLAKVRSAISSDGQALDLGDILMSEAWPVVIAIDPETGAQEVGTTAQVHITFSEPIATNSISGGGIYLRGPESAVACNLDWDPPLPGENGTRVVHLRPHLPLQSHVTYRVFVLSGTTTDGLGRPIGQGPVSLVDRPLPTPFSSSFSTRDGLPPALVSIAPEPGSEQVDPVVVARLTFSEPLSFDGLSVTLEGPGGAVAGTTALTLNGTVLTFTPKQALAVNGTFTLRVNGARDLVGNPVANLPIVSSFNTKDTRGPVLSALRLVRPPTAVAGAPALLEAQLASAEDGVVVRFSGNLNPLGVATSSPFQIPVTLPLSGPIAYRAIAIDRFGNEGALAEFAPTLVPNQPPVVSLVRDTPADEVLPSGQDFSVLATATDDVGVADIALVASGALESSTDVAGDAHAPVAFTVPASARTGETLIVAARATDLLGEVSTVATLNYRIVDGTEPSLAILSPAEGASLNAAAPLEIVSTVADNSANLQLILTLSGALVQTQEVSLALSPGEVATNTFTASLANVPRNGAALTASLRAVDEAGNSRTVTRNLLIPDTQPPRLLTLSPTNGAPRQSLWLNSMSFRFDEALAVATVSSNTVQLTNAAGSLAPHRVLSGGIGLVQVLPTALPLLPGVVYTNVLSPELADAAGNGWVDQDGHAPPPEGQGFTFTTAAILETTPAEHTPVIAGQTLNLRVDFEPGLGATAFGFSLNAQPPVTVNVSPDATSATTTLTLRNDETLGVVHISAQRFGQSPSALPDITLDVRPFDGDEDGDGLPNGYEIAHHLDPFAPDANLDPDHDDLTSRQEFLLGTNPNQVDTDDDGLTDGQEVALGGCLDPLNSDSDGDGLPDGQDPAPCFVGAGVVIEVPAEISVVEGAFTSLVVRAVSDLGPVARFEFDSANPAPLFARLESQEFANTTTNGTASATLGLAPTFDAAGTYTLTLRALVGDGTEVTTNVTVQVIDDPSLLVTHWMGGSNGNWSHAARWSAGSPDGTKIAVIDAEGTYQVTLDGPGAVAGLILGGASGSQTLSQAGFTLTLDGTSEVRGNGVLLLRSGTLTGTGLLTVGGRMDWLGGVLSGAGRTVVGPSGVVNSDGAAGKSLNRVLQNSGSMALSGAGAWITTGGRIVNLPGGLVTAQGFTLANSSGGSFSNQGTFVVVGTGVVTFGAPFHNQGTVTLTSGTLNWNVGGSHSTILDVAEGATLSLNGTFTTSPGSVLGGAGVIRFPGGIHTFEGEFLPTRAAAFEGGTITISNALPITAITNLGATVNFQVDQRFDRLVLQRGTIAGRGDIRLTGPMLWNNGTLGGTGRFVTGPDSLIELFGTFPKTLSRTVDNHGLMSMTGPGVVSLSAPILNRPDGVLAIENLTVGASGGSLTNEGALVAQGVNTINSPIDNAGALTISSGTSTLGLNLVNSGLVTVENGASLVLNGTGTLSSGTSLQGDGTLRFRNALNLGAPVDFGGLTTGFENSAFVTGPWAISNAPGGTLLFSRTLTLPGDVTIGGTMTLGTGNISVTISNTLTLLTGAILNNPGVVRAGAFVDEGGTVNGNPPDLMHPPAPLPPIVQIELRAQAVSGGGSSVRVASSSQQIVLKWHAAPGDRFTVQTSADLRNWSDLPVQALERRPGAFEAEVRAPVAKTAFYRLRPD